MPNEEQLLCILAVGAATMPSSCICAVKGPIVTSLPHVTNKAAHYTGRRNRGKLGVLKYSFITAAILIRKMRYIQFLIPILK
jgi:hypothetical protein